MTEHTPTPWSIGEYGKVQSEGMASWDSINVSGFALCNWGEAEANAHHIVKCVNSHDRLVEALERLSEVVDAGPEYKISLARQRIAAIKDARALLTELENDQ